MVSYTHKRGGFAAAWRRADLWPGSAIGVAFGLSVLIVATLLVVMWLSIVKGSPGDADLTYTLSNYTEAFSDPGLGHMLSDTFAFSFVTLVIAVLFGLPAAWLVERTDIKGKAVVFTFMTGSLLTPGFALAMGWLYLLHTRFGLVNVWLRTTFGLTEPVFNVGTIIGMGFVQGLGLAPVVFIMTAAVFRAIDPSLEESAAMSGANPRQTMFKVTLRLAWPGILAASIYVFTIGFAAFDVPAMIGWGARLYTFSTYLVLLLRPEQGAPNYGVAAALSTVVIGLSLVLTLWYTRILKQAHRYQVVSGKSYRPNIIQLKKRAIGAWVYLAIYFLMAQIVPVLVIVWASLIPFFQLPSAKAFQLVSLRTYENLPWQLIIDSLGNTAILTILTPTVTLIVSLAFSWVVLRSRVPGRTLFDVAAFLPHAVPNIIFAVGALILFLFVLDRFIPLYGTLWALLIVFVVGRISYGTRMTNSGLIQVHKELEESAQMSGATTSETMLKIATPLMAPTMLYAWLWMALLTFRELTLAVALTTRDNITLPIVIWSSCAGGKTGDASAMAVSMLLLMVPLIALFWMVVRKRGLVQ